LVFVATNNQKEPVEILKKNFVKLISENQKLIHKVCNVYCYTPEDRKDLFQDIVLQLWRSYSSFKGEAKFSTWLYSVSLNTAITQMRKPKKKMVELNSNTTDNLIAENGHENFEKHQLLQSLIKELNSVEKSIILLYLEEKTYQEIAHIMGMSKTNVSVRLVRIKKKLEEIFKQQPK